jgi:hypothetical protein
MAASGGLDVRLPAVVVHALAARHGLIAQITFGRLVR